MHQSRATPYTRRRNCKLISISLILVIGLILSLGALSFRMPWEEVFAFIAGPTLLLVMVIMGSHSLGASKPAAASASGASLSGKSESASRIIDLAPAVPIAEPAGGIAAFTLPIGLLLLAALLYGRRKYIVFELEGLWHRYGGSTRIFNTLRDKKSEQDPVKGALYYETAIRLGALVAKSDGKADPLELTALKRIFLLNEGAYPQTDAVYQDQLSNPQKMSAIIAPFVSRYGQASPGGETIVFGMCCIGMAHGMTPSELGVIHIAADKLGFKPAAVSRILMSAGYFGAANQSSRKRQSSNSYTSSGGQRQSSWQNASQQTAYGTMTERATHLQTLGLSANANQALVKKTWRQLARAHHPDKLVSKNLSAEELEKSEDRMQAINEAYNWLKEHG